MISVADNIEGQLRELEGLLREHEVRFAQSVSDAIASISQSPFSQRDTVATTAARRLFGAMGSLTDVWISRANGHVVSDEVEANGKLAALREGLWETLEEPADDFDLGL